MKGSFGCGVKFGLSSMGGGIVSLEKCGSSAARLATGVRKRPLGTVFNFRALNVYSGRRLCSGCTPVVRGCGPG